MRQPVYFLSHGGGPWPWLEGPFRRAFDWLEASLVALPQQLPEVPRAVLAVSGHWEEPGFTVSSASAPGMVYDYFGFPEHTYHIRYPAPGSPEVAARVVELAQAAGIPVGTDPARGFDHGTFSMLKPIWPEAEVPVVSLSLRADYDPAAHIALGRALAPLRDEGVLIVGSGNVIHNLALWRQYAGTQPDWALEFRDRINAAVTADDHAALTRFAPDDQAAAAAINSAEHYLPLLYIVGARLPGDAVGTFNDTVSGALSMTSYVIGDTAPLAAIA